MNRVTRIIVKQDEGGAWDGVEVERVGGAVYLTVDSDTERATIGMDSKALKKLRRALRDELTGKLADYLEEAHEGAIQAEFYDKPSTYMEEHRKEEPGCTYCEAIAEARQ